MAFVPVSRFVDALGQLTTDARLFLISLKDQIVGVVTNVTATSPIVSSGGTTPNITHAVSGVTAATYGDSTHVAQVAIDAKGHVTSASAVAIAAGSVTSVSGTAPIASSGGATPAISLNDTAVTPATYGDSTHVAQVTLDAKGRATSAANVAITAGGIGASVIYTSAFASPPGSPAAGDLWIPSDSYYQFRYSGSAWIPWGPVFPFTDPTLQTFAWINQGGASIDTTKGGIYLQAPANTGTNMRIRKKAVPVGATWSVTAAFRALGYPGKNQECGLVYRASGSGALLTFGVNALNQYLISQYFSSPTTFSGGNVADNLYTQSDLKFFRLADDGVNRIMSYSVDGQHFIPINSTGRTVNLTADEVGFYVNEGSNVLATGMTLLSWVEGA